MDQMEDRHFGPSRPYGVVSARQAEGTESRFDRRRQSRREFRTIWVAFWVLAALYGYYLDGSAINADNIQGELMVFFGGVIAAGSTLIWTGEWWRSKKFQKRRVARLRELRRQAAHVIHF
jgi:O-antigen/teichoic acid export membrane protein